MMYTISSSFADRVMFDLSRVNQTDHTDYVNGWRNVSARVGAFASSSVTIWDTLSGGPC